MVIDYFLLWYPIVINLASSSSEPVLETISELGCCSICLEGYFHRREVLVTSCNHRYHEYCITKWLKTRDLKTRDIRQLICPVCRSIAVPLVRESSSLFDDDEETNPFVESQILSSVRLGRCDFIAQLLVSNPEIVSQRFLSAISGNKIPLLYIAAQEGHRELAAVLLAAGAPVDAPSHNGATPLFIAVQNGHQELVAVLLVARARVNAPRNDGTTPLHIAVLKGQLDLAVQLLVAGAAVNARCENGDTPLHFAAQKGYPELAAYLLAVGARVNAARNDGTTPLYIAAQNGHRELVTKLLLAGADPRKKWRPFGPRKQSAIEVARQNNHDDIAQLLTDWIRDRRGGGCREGSDQPPPMTVILARARMAIRH